MKNKILLVMFLFSVMLFNNIQVAKGESEKQLAKTAEKYFLAKQYDKASPLFAQLVSSNPKSYKYNYYYGICLLIAGKDKSQALPYLEIALDNPKTPEDIYYYMGRAMHLNYRFEEAMRSFTEFNSIIGMKDASRWSTPQLMEMCNNAKRILDTTKNSVIQERMESVASDFYSHYNFNSGNGKLLSMPDEIIKNSKSDNDERPMIFLSANGRVMYYSATNSENSSHDIFRVEKDLDNNWTEPVRLDNVVNSSQDELFPSCNPDGRILYFSSRGHNTTGGFDIFKAYYNTVSKSWSQPVNMGSPYNSPDDDYCFVASAEDQIAYFTSQRETGPGNFTIYKVRYANTEELPVAINGKFKCIGYPDLKSIKLTIQNTTNEATVADLMTDKETGSYAVELPGPGVYKFTVQAEGFQVHDMNVSFQEFSDNIFVQDIYLSRNESGKEDLAISNRKLNESDILDGTLTASVDENGNTTSGVTTKNSMNKTGMLNSGESSLANGNTSATNGDGIPNDQVNVPSITGIQFKVQIGAFRKHTREIVQKRLEKKADKNMMTNYDDLSWLRFFIGTETNYLSAKNLKSTLVQAGFKDAFIVAFEAQKPMNLTEAINKSGKR